MPSPGPATDPQRKAAALDVAAQRGVAAASRETGIPASTIRSWRSRERKADNAPALAQAPAYEPTGREDVDQLRQAAAETYQVAVEAREAARRAIRGGKSQGVRDLMVAYGVGLDQAGKLRAAADQLERDHVRMDHAEQERLVEIVRVAIRACGLPSTFERVIGATWRSALEGGEITAPAEDVERVRDELRRRFQGSTPPGITRVPCMPDVRKALELAGPPVASELAAAANSDDEEVVDAEAVDDSKPRGVEEKGVYHEALERYENDEDRAREALDNFREQRPERERRYAEANEAWDALHEHQQNQLLCEYAGREDLAKRAAVQMVAGRAGRLSGFQPSIAAPFRATAGAGR